MSRDPNLQNIPITSGEGRRLSPEVKEGLRREIAGRWRGDDLEPRDMNLPRQARANRESGSSRWWYTSEETGYVIGEGDVEIAHVPDIPNASDREASGVAYPERLLQESARGRAMLMSAAPDMLELLQKMSNNGLYGSTPVSVFWDDISRVLLRAGWHPAKA